MRLRVCILCVIAAFALSAPLRAADPVWIEIDSPHFIVFTDTTEAKGRRLIENFESRYAAMSAAFGEIPERQFPIEIFLFGKKEEFLEAAPRPTGPEAPREFQKSAYLWRGADRVFIGARDKSPDDIADDVGHALGHILFERLVLWRPFWLEEAAAEYFRKAGAKPDTKRISEKDGYPVEDILEIIPRQEYDDDAPASPFRIQAHRLLRVLITQHPDEVRDFLSELRSEEGVEAQLGLDTDNLQAELEAYTETLIPLGSPSGNVDLPALDKTRIPIHRGDLLLAAERTSEAAAWYNGDGPDERAARAILSRFSRGGSEATRLLSSASQEFPNMGLLQFHFGSLQTSNVTEIELQAKALERAAELLPRMGRVRGQLARVYARLGRGEEALGQTERAVELEPEFADEFFLIRAEAFLALNRFGEATQTVRLAANLPHASRAADFERKTSELASRVEETRREIEGQRLQQIREEVKALVAEREPPPPPPPPPPPEKFGSIQYSVQAGRQIRILNAPMPVYSNSLIQQGASGNVVVRLTVGRDGKVTQASVISSQIEGMNSATLDAAKRWTFGASSTAGTYEVRVTFKFAIQ